MYLPVNKAKKKVSVCQDLQTDKVSTIQEMGLGKNGSVWAQLGH